MWRELEAQRNEEVEKEYSLEMPSWTHHLESSGIIVTIPAGGYLNNSSEGWCWKKPTVIRLAAADVVWSSAIII